MSGLKLEDGSYLVYAGFGQETPSHVFAIRIENGRMWIHDEGGFIRGVLGDRLPSGATHNVSIETGMRILKNYYGDLRYQGVQLHQLEFTRIRPADCPCK